MKIRLWIVVVSLVLAYGSFLHLNPPVQAENQAGAASTGDYVPGEVLVKFRTNMMVQHSGRRLVTGIDSVDAVMRRHGVTAVTPIFPQTLQSEQASEQVYKLTLDNPDSVLSVVGALSANAHVDYAEPNYVVHISAPITTQHQTPPHGALTDDTFSADLWSLHNTGQTGGREDADIDAPEAWAITTGSRDVTIAVVDTGVDYTHEDLNDGRVLTDSDIDLVNNDDDGMDDQGHGTHVAGIIAAEANNKTGSAGVMWSATILPVKALDASGIGTSDDIAQGIRYAADNGADIINMSLGILLCSNVIADAINYATFEQGSVVVAAAGNAGSNLDYPAKFMPVISVGATDHHDNVASFSNRGEQLDVVAPGVAILSTIPGNSYDFYSGTSMATPHVAGVIGLLLAQNPDLSAEQIRAILHQSADDLGERGFDSLYGYGRVNAYRALQTPVPTDRAAPQQAACSECAASAAALLMPERDQHLNALWKLESDIFQQSDTGQELITLFYRHSPEVRTILFQHPTLLIDTQSILSGILPVVHELTGEGEPVIITEELITELAAFNDAITMHASSELGHDLDAFWARYNPEQFIGMSANEAWQQMNQTPQTIHRIYMPIVIAAE